MNERYCILCGNEKTRTKDSIGQACRALIKTTMQRPMQFWRKCGESHTKCCGGLATEKDHLYFHGDGWECSYPAAPTDLHYAKSGTTLKPTKKAKKEWEQFHVSVEMGVSFYADHACTYYLRDFDSYCDSEEYGEALPYPADVADQAFWDALDKQLDRAAEAAFNSDLLTCFKCGYHYYDGPCKCGAAMPEQAQC